MIGERLKKARKQKKWSQKDLSERSTVSFEQISRYETGKHKPHKDVLLKLAEALDVPAEYLEGNISANDLEKSIGPSPEYFRSLLEKAMEAELSGKERKSVTDFLELILMRSEIQKVAMLK